MKLFEFTQDEVIVNQDLLQIAVFQKLLNQKDYKQIFAYIYHLCDYSSPYAIYPEEVRQQMLLQDILNGKKPNKDIEIAITKYRELATTESLLLLESARNAVRKLRDYFDTVDFTMSEEPGKEAKDLMANLKSVGAIIQALKDWEEQIKKETNSSDTRKGVALTKYNAE